MNKLWARLAGEWLAFWWLLKGIVWNACDGLTWAARGFKAWRVIRPLGKCRECGSWQQRCVLVDHCGICCKCNALLMSAANDVCGDGLSEEDVPF